MFNHKLEKIESRVDQTTFLYMKASLQTLKSQHDPMAHTHIKGITLRIDVFLQQ